MAPRVVVLAPELASQIAAGEVVERPASAVKELVENSLDAGATRCDVEIEGGGIALIRVRDDGHGMAEDDARRSVERHATSKLKAIDDLRLLHSFGFRGEALPSIASVSRLSLITCNREGGQGVEIFVEGTRSPVVKPGAASPGTIVEVRDLFFNVPARRKFLRSTGTESGHVAEVLESLALARPDVTLTLMRDGRRSREWLRAGTRAERVLGVDPELLTCSGERGPLRVEAYLSRPQQARTGAAGLRLLVNGRAIRDRAVALTVAQSYGSVLERGRYPRGVVYLDLPTEFVDINVHPQKAEVRFADPRVVTDAVYGVLSRALATALSTPAQARTRFGAPPNRSVPPADRTAETEDDSDSPDDPIPQKGPDRTASPTAGAANPKAPAAELARGKPVVGRPLGRGSVPAIALDPAEEPARFARTLATANEPTDPEVPATLKTPTPTFPPPLRRRYPEQETGAQEILGTGRQWFVVQDSATPPPPTNRSEVDWGNLRFLAQIRNTFLVCEGSDGLYVLDQHAAAERVNFHRLRTAYQARKVGIQSLLFPLNLEISVDEMAIVEEHSARILEVGVDIRMRGPQAASVHGIPKLLHRADPEKLVRNLLAEMTKAGGRGFSDAVDIALARMACHGSVRAGDALTADEVAALLRALQETDFAGFCPHGRPVVTFTSFAELERKVGRR